MFTYRVWALRTVQTKRRIDGLPPKDRCTNERTDRGRLFASVNKMMIECLTTTKHKVVAPCAKLGQRKRGRKRVIRVILRQQRRSLRET